MEGIARKAATVRFRELTKKEEFETAQGLQIGKSGDFALTNPDGETYPCPRDTFLTTYIIVDDSAKEVK